MRNFLGKLGAALALSVIVTTCSPAAYAGSTPPDRYIIKNDTGGLITEYRKAYAYLSKNKIPIAVDGICMSACTIMLSSKYDIDFCVTSDAVFQFHEPFMGRETPMGLQIGRTAVFIADMKREWEEGNYKMMPVWARALIDANGGVPSVNRGQSLNDTFDITYDMMKAHVATCSTVGDKE